MLSLLKFAPIAGLLFKNQPINQLNESDLRSVANCFGEDLAPHAYLALESIYAAAAPGDTVNDVLQHPLLQSLMKSFTDGQAMKQAEGSPVFCTCPSCGSSFETAV